jgi:4-amino-4-deoxy-L-arabinose transferase-like glycosyltransferase
VLAGVWWTSPVSAIAPRKTLARVPARRTSSLAWSRVARLAGLAPALVALTALAAILRFATLGVQSFWFDEVITVTIVELPFVAMLEQVRAWESSPPLYYLLAWLWTQAFGSDEVGLRSLSALFGTATVPVVYHAGRVAASRRAGLFAAALTAVSPLLVWYSQEARAYSLFVFLSALSLLGLARALEHASPRRLALWAAAAALALATHYFALFLVAAEGAVLLLYARPRRRVLAACGAVAAVALALLPLLLHQRERNWTEWLTEKPLSGRTVQVVQQFLLGYQREALVVLAAAYVFVVVVVVFARLASRHERAGACRFGAVAAASVVAPLLLAVAGMDAFFFRNLVGAWPAFALALGALLAAERAPRGGLAATAAICACALLAVGYVAATPSVQRTDWRATGQALGPPSPQRATVVAPAYEWQTLEHYRPGMKVAEPGPIRVLEIDALSYYGPSSAPALPSAFRRVSVKALQHVTRARYRAPEPVLVSRAQLASLAPDGQTLTVLVER